MKKLLKGQISCEAVFSKQALRPSHVVLPKIGISRKNRDFAQKSGFQAPMSKILGFQVHTVGGALRVHFEIPIFCHGRPVGT